MLVELANNHFGSLSKNVPDVKLINLYITNNPISQTGSSFISRPTLAQFTSFPNKIISGIFYQQGYHNDDIFCVVGTDLICIDATGATTIIGSIPGTGLCSFSATIFHLCILRDGVIYLYDGSTLVTTSLPDGLQASSLAPLNNYIVIVAQGTNKYYWINPGDTFVDPLSFASAEFNPDSLIACKTTTDELWLLGTTTAEVWYPTGTADAPFQRISGRVFNTGCIDPISVSTIVYNTLPAIVWVSGSKEVMLAQGSPTKISTEFVEEAIKNATSFFGWFLRRNKNDFYVLTTNTITVVYDLSLGVWYKWVSYAKNTWKASLGVQRNSEIFACNLGLEGVVYKLDSDRPVDLSADWLVCEVTGIIRNPTQKPLPCTSLDVVCNNGYSSSYLTVPLIEVRWSDDLGSNWSTYMQTSLNSRGDTSTTSSFRSLGLIKIPGRFFEFRFSGVNTFRLDYVNMNRD